MTYLFWMRVELGSGERVSRLVWAKSYDSAKWEYPNTLCIKPFSFV